MTMVRSWLVLSLLGVALMAAALLLAFTAAEVHLRPWSASRVYGSCGVIRVYELWEGLPLKSGVNVTVYNVGDTVVRVDGRLVPPGGRVVLRGEPVVNVSGAECRLRVRVDGYIVEQPYALLSIPAAALSVAGMALVLYSLARKVSAG